MNRSSYGRARCERHGGKLRDCGCDPFLWMDTDWAHQRAIVKARRLGRLYGRHRERMVLEAILGESRFQGLDSKLAELGEVKPPVPPR